MVFLISALFFWVTAVSADSVGLDLSILKNNKVPDFSIDSFAINQDGVSTPKKITLRGESAGGFNVRTAEIRAQQEIIRLKLSYFNDAAPINFESLLLLILKDIVEQKKLLNSKGSDQKTAKQRLDQLNAIFAKFPKERSLLLQSIQLWKKLMVPLNEVTLYSPLTQTLEQITINAQVIAQQEQEKVNGSITEMEASQRKSKEKCDVAKGLFEQAKTNMEDMKNSCKKISNSPTAIQDRALLKENCTKTRNILEQANTAAKECVYLSQVALRNTIYALNQIVSALDTEILSATPLQGLILSQKQLSSNLETSIPISSNYVGNVKLELKVFDAIPDENNGYTYGLYREPRRFYMLGKEKDLEELKASLDVKISLWEKQSKIVQSDIKKLSQKKEDEFNAFATAKQNLMDVQKFSVDVKKAYLEYECPELPITCLTNQEMADLIDDFKKATKPVYRIDNVCPTDFFVGHQSEAELKDRERAVSRIEDKIKYIDDRCREDLDKDGLSFIRRLSSTLANSISVDHQIDGDDHDFKFQEIMGAAKASAVFFACTAILITVKKSAGIKFVRDEFFKTADSALEQWKQGFSSQCKKVDVTEVFLDCASAGLEIAIGKVITDKLKVNPNLNKTIRAMFAAVAAGRAVNDASKALGSIAADVFKNDPQGGVNFFKSLLKVGKALFAITDLYGHFKEAKGNCEKNTVTKDDQSKFDKFIEDMNGYLSANPITSTNLKKYIELLDNVFGVASGQQKVDEVYFKP